MASCKFAATASTSHFLPLSAHEMYEAHCGLLIYCSHLPLLLIVGVCLRQHIFNGFVPSWHGGISTTLVSLALLKQDAWSNNPLTFWARVIGTRYIRVQNSRHRQWEDNRSPFTQGQRCLGVLRHSVRTATAGRTTICCTKRVYGQRKLRCCQFREPHMRNMTFLHAQMN